MIRFLHTRIRVSDLEKSIDWYSKFCGFSCSRRSPKSPAGNELAFLEIEGNQHFLELCYSPDYEVQVPEDLMHTCIGVEDIAAYCDQVEKDGEEVWPGNWREKAEQGEFWMAFLTDPDGYEVEILQRDYYGVKSKQGSEESKV